jgi:hypothetical protein
MTESDVIFTNLEIIRDKCKENNIIPHYYFWCDGIHTPIKGYTLDYEKLRSCILQLYDTGCKLTDTGVRCDIDIPGLSGYVPTNKLWHRTYYEYWSIDIKWLLIPQFMKDFESELDQRVLYSLFQ